MSASAAVLEAVGGARVALQDVKVEGTIRDLMAEVMVTQVYRNEESAPIEAVYTFPLPLDAVLLELTVSLGDRTLTGTVVPRGEAEERYEEAITDGYSAILLQQVCSGLYTMNVGNLDAGETASIRFRYAMLQRWNGDEIRFMLPTAIAPRYGDPSAAGLAPHQQPEYSLAAELRYELHLAVEGLLAGADIDSPSHAITVDRADGKSRVMLGRTKAALDRDFVLTFALPGGTRPSARTGRDLEGYVALASFKPEFAKHRDEAPKDVTLVVDCSGSMGGDSIAQARTALLLILDALRPGDNFDILAFGTSHQALFGTRRPASPQNLTQARRFTQGLDANMGGTEIGRALQAAYRLSGGTEGGGEMLVITDGEVWEEAVFEEAQRSGHRIFTVGVGSAVAEGFVRRLAEATGGVCEPVSPREDMARKIHRHFQRMYCPPGERAAVQWPQAPLAVFPEQVGPVYEGDTVHAFAWFKDEPRGTVSMLITLPGDETITQSAELSSTPVDEGQTNVTGAVPETLARMAAGTRLKKLDDEAAGSALALRYQLMSPWTNYLVIAERAEGEKTDELPMLRKVPQMPAAGWGGMGAVNSALCEEPIRFSKSMPDDVDAQIDHWDIPAFLREGVETDGPAPDGMTGPGEFLENLNRVGANPPLNIWDLNAMGLPIDFVVALQCVVVDGADEGRVALTFLYLLCQSEAGHLLNRDVRRIILKTYKAIPPAADMITAVYDSVTEMPAWQSAMQTASTLKNAEESGQ